MYRALKCGEVDVHPVSVLSSHKSFYPSGAVSEAIIGSDLIPVVLPVMHLRLGVEDDDPSGTGHHLVEPPVMQHDLPRLFRGIPDELSSGRIQHHRVSTRDVLNQSVGERGLTAWNAGSAKRVQVLVADEGRAAVKSREVNRDHAQFLQGATQLAGKPEVILISERNMVPCPVAKVGQHGQKILRRPAAWAVSQLDPETGVMGGPVTQPFHTVVL